MTVYGPYPATVTKIHDGDTIRVNCDLGFGVSFDVAARIWGIDAPELGTAAGKAALTFLRTIVHLGDRVTVLSKSWDKYGDRADCVVTLADGADLGAAMVESGHAVSKNYT